MTLFGTYRLTKSDSANTRKRISSHILKKKGFIWGILKTAMVKNGSTKVSYIVRMSTGSSIGMMNGGNGSGPHPRPAKNARVSRRVHPPLRQQQPVCELSWRMMPLLFFHSPLFYDKILFHRFLSDPRFDQIQRDVRQVRLFAVPGHGKTPGFNIRVFSAHGLETL